MPKNGRFMVGLAGVATIATYLIWTGVSDAMVYYMTPGELLARIEADSTFADVGVKISGEVVPESYEALSGELHHRFVLRDLLEPEVEFTVEYRGILPDTFNDAPEMRTEAVIQGRFGESGAFQANTVLTKCGSRYEAAPDQLRDDPQATEVPDGHTE